MDNHEQSPEQPGDHRLTQAACYNDAIAEEYGLLAVCAQIGVEVEPLLYVAKQRALRCVLAVTGRHDELRDANRRSTLTPILLSPEEDELCRALTLAALDGIVIGLRASQIDT